MECLKVAAVELQRIENTVEEIRRKRQNLPKGQFYCYQTSRNETVWYGRVGKKRFYISKKERERAKELAKSFYYQLQEEECEKKIKTLQRIMAIKVPQVSKSKEFLESHPEITSMLEDDWGWTEEVKHWAREEYISNPFYLERLIYKTARGEMVRSKSEMIIADLLYEMHIPYRYEACLNVAGQNYYPDFTILNPVNMEMYYLEHLGLLGNDGYEVKNQIKLMHYIKAGIIPGINLIITDESDNRPFDVSFIRMQLKHYLS